MLKPAAVWSASRCLCLAACALSARFIPNHDFSHDLTTEAGCLSFLVRWDALYFYRIAKHGYTEENMTAFFPLYPMLIRALAWLGLSYTLSGALISNGSFLASALVLHRVTEKFLGEKNALRACILFCFSPCSVIYSALYTEAIFCLFVLLAVRSALSRNARPLAFLWVSLASAVRSNGFILAPLVLLETYYKRMHRLALGLCALPLVTFLGIQAYWWTTRFPHISTLPYSYVQAVYWEQGFLEFYKHPKNIPNLIVGLPFVLLSCIVLGSYARREISVGRALVDEAKRAGPFEAWRKVFEAPARAEVPVLGRKAGSAHTEEGAGNKKKARESRHGAFWVLRLFLQCVLLFQVVLSLFFIHMNMHFRFVSYNPAVYWELAEIFKKGGFWKLLLFGYICFGFAYSVLYGAYFPPA
ncbi:GPI mannosyltransferase 2 [Nematocida major]|uniref:GPI mannosyltransferase 2 n=1 Tax=Nematocida major TaxID=1912982 RepID=UPI00200847BA|nr:GPI mannosyltransferase 2 [Nematocida major]KAH9386533.1 GPI mannosyltransferase 2 [Nematocida major]